MSLYDQTKMPELEHIQLMYKKIITNENRHKTCSPMAVADPASKFREGNFSNIL